MIKFLNKNRMYTKRWLLCLLFVLYSLCGCTNKKPEESVPELVISIPVRGEEAQIERINRAANEYLEQKLNIKIKIIANETQSNIRRINTKQQLDIAYCGVLSQVQLMQSSGLLLPLDELLTSYGKKIVSVIPAEYYEFTRTDGKLYAIPTNKERFRINVFEYNKNVAEQYNLDMSKVHSVDDLTEVFAELYAQTDQIAPVALVPHFLYYDQVNNIGDGFGVLTGQNENTVVNLYETNQFSEFVELVRRWYLAGYLFSDVEENDLIIYYLQSGKVFGCITTGKPGFATQEQRLSDSNLDSVDLGEPYFSDDTLTRAWYTIPVTAKYPELSMKLMELLYSDSYLANLLMYGIEGEDYQLNEQGQVIRQESSGYDGVDCWAYCNSYCAYTELGQTLSYWQDIEQLNQDAAKSIAWGFLFDPSEVSEELYRCEQVRERYLYLFYSGCVDPAELLENFQAELYDAGIQKIIKQKQYQLNSYLEDRPNE